jgi:nucleoside-diphosphate-sugar epimerase
MKIFVAGGTGAVGKRLVPLLLNRGHEVTATTRTPEKAAALGAAGTEPVMVDGLDDAAMTRVMLAARPEVVVHQMTALGNLGSLRNLDREFALTNRLRTEGTEILLRAARAAGATRLVAQSYTGWPNERSGGRVKTEEDPLDPNPPRSMSRTLDAIRVLERSVLSASDLRGTVLRYGSLYGPGTSIAPGGEVLEAVRRRRLPILGDGAGVWSFVQIDDAAEATRIAIEGGPAGLYNIADDEPAEVATWLPDLASAIGAPPPRHVPVWLGRLLAGEALVLMMTEIRGSSNAKARRDLGWRPRYPSWREGFRSGLS